MTAVRERTGWLDAELLPARRRGLLTLTVVLVAAFGPYLTGSIRTEQAAVYLTAVALAPFALPRVRPSRHTVGVFAAWGLYAFVVVFGAVAPPLNQTQWAQNSALNGVDNVLLPLAVVVVVLELLALGADRQRLLGRAAFLTVVLMLVNAGAALLTSYRGHTWQAWWSPVGDSSTAVNAAELGRYSGLISEPAAAGVLYGLAMLCALFLWPSRLRVLLPVCLVLGAGGVLTGSKVFFAAVIPLVGWQMLRIRERRRARVGGVLLSAAGIYLILQAGFLPAWTGANPVSHVFAIRNADLVSGLTGNRYGTGSTLRPVTDAVLGGPAWFGFGGGGLQTPYDSGYVEALVMAGVFGVACLVATCVVLAFKWRRMAAGRERTLLGCIILLLATSSIGVPAFTSNRVATVLWMLLALLLAAPVQDRTQ